MKKLIIAIILVSSISACFVLRKTKYYDVATEQFYPFLAEYQSMLDEEDSVKVYDVEIDSLIPIPNKYLYYTYFLGTWAPSNWARNPENLWGIHNSLKKIGYLNFIPKKHYFVKWHPAQDYTLSTEIDSFYYNYIIPNQDTSNYYFRFWERRKKEGNAEVLFVILDEIKQIYESDVVLNFEANAINDTIFTLLNFEYRTDKMLYSNKKQFELEYFNYLKGLKLEQSAFNLVNYTKEFSNVKINRDSLNKTLQIKEITYEQWLPMYQEGKGYWIFKSFTEH